MRPILTAVIAAIEAFAVALAGLVAVVIPAFAMWLVSFDLGPDPALVFAASVSVWLLAHLIPLEFHIGPEAALGYGLPPEAVDFTVSLAPLGLTLLTVLLAMRAGYRFARDGGSGAAGVAGGTVGFSAAALLLSQFAVATDGAAVWYILLVPAALYGSGMLIAFVARAARDQHEWLQGILRRLDRQLQRIRPGAVDTVHLAARETIRMASASLAILTAAAAVGIASAIIAGYIEITTLTQALQLDVLGVLVLFLGQLAFIPTLCVWAIAWLSGAGFALGVGSSVSPFDALTGPLPSLPILGALPAGWGGAAILAPALVVVFALGLGVLAARLTELRRSGPVTLVIVPVLAAALTGLVVAGLSALATGSVGPDRLSQVGPRPWMVGGLIAGELAVGLLLGIMAGRIDRQRLTSVFHALDRPADPVPEAHYLHVSRSPSRELLFRSVGRARRKSAESAHTPSVAPPDAPGEQDDASAATIPIRDRDLPLSTDEGQSLADDEDSSEVADALSTDQQRATSHLPPADADDAMSDDTEAEATRDGGDATGQGELTREEEAELLRAFSWEGEDPPSEPSRPGWRLPRRKR